MKKGKKIIIVILVVVAVLCGIGYVGSCLQGFIDGVENCTHSWEVVEEVPATCETDGVKKSKCSVCYENKEEILPALGHDYVGRECSRCGDMTASEGLKFKTEYGKATVIGMGTCTDDIVVIPEEYDGCVVEKIGSYAFRDSPMVKIVIPETIDEIGNYAFIECRNLTEINIPESVRWIGYGISAYCTSLNSITVDSQNTAFKAIDNCLMTKDEDELFAGCKNSVIPNGVKEIYIGAFAGHSGIAELIIPNTVTKIWGSAFSDCDSLTEIVIPDSVVEIQNYAFKDCDGVERVSLGSGLNIFGKYYDNYQYTYYSAFSGCNNLSSITVSSENDVYKSEGNCVVEKDTNTLVLGCKNSVIPNYVTTIQDYAFDRYSSLTNVNIPDSVTCIKSKAFNWCQNISYTVDGGIKYLGNSNNRYRWLVCAVEPDRITNASINANCKYVMEYALISCSNIEEIILPDGLLSIGKQSFSHLTKLETISIPDSVTHIDYSAFYGCTSLQYTKENGLNYLGNSNNRYRWLMVTNSSSTESFEINGNCKYIISYAFRECWALNNVIIPVSVTNIGEDIFFSNYIHEVTYMGLKSQWQSIEKPENWDRGLINVVHCSDGDIQY